MYPDLISPTTPPELMSLTELRDLLGLTGVDPPSDAQLTFALNMASEIIRSETGRFLALDTYKDRFLIVRQGDILSLSEYPLHQVTSITIDGQAVTDYDYRQHARTGILYPSRPSLGEVVIEYSAGYDPLPYDLQGVLIELARRQLQSMNLPSGAVSGDPPIKAVGIGNLRVDYAISPSPDAGNKQMLSPALAEVVSQFSGVLFGYRHSRMMGATG